MNDISISLARVYTPDWTLALFDQIGFGLVVCDAEGRIRYANASAQHELADTRLVCRAEGRLVRAEGCSGELAGAIRLAATRGRRSMVALHRGEDRLLATAAPLADGGDSLALVMLGRRQACSELEVELLGSSYGLTLAERRVLAELVRDATPVEIADRFEVKLSTVRTHIHAIRGKLGVRNVEGLLLRAAQMPRMAAAYGR